jgi:energy-coupling factor transport system ATP-binding protein
MILDEPTRGLDYKAKRYLGDTLIKLNKEGMTIIIVTHDIGFAHDYCHRSVIMSQGELITSGNTDHVLNQSYSYVTEAGKLFKGINSTITSEKGAITFLKDLIK